MTLNLTTPQPVTMSKQNVQPLIEFSFAKYLADPCGFKSIGDDENSPMAHDLINSVRQKYHVNSVLFSMERVGFVKQFLLILREVKLRAQFLHPVGSYISYIFKIEILNLIFGVYLKKDLIQCSQIELTALSDINRLINSQVNLNLIHFTPFSINCVFIILKGELNVEEIYRSLALTFAHLHLMIRHVDGAKCFPIDDPLQQKNVRM